MRPNNSRGPHRYQFVARKGRITLFWIRSDVANLASRVPKTSWPMIATLVRSIFEQPDRDTT